jgi:heterodisulfide reductase subunit C
MDYKPNQILHMVSMGMKERVLSCKTIWVCSSCYICSTRCPNDIDIARVMDWLRQTALQEGVVPAEKEIPLFHAAFLDSIRTYGRVHEFSMVARYKMRSGKLWEDFKLGWKLFTKGKLKLLPSGMKRRKEVSELFRREKS